MKKLLILLLFPLMMFSQDSTLIGDVDCSGEVNSQDASLILQFVTNVIDSLPCQDNMTGLTPEQLQEIINMMDEQLSINYSGGGGSSNYPAMISSRSSEEMYLGEAFVYCNDLEEGGYSDWFLPNLDLLTYAISGGCELPDERTTDYLLTTSKFHGPSSTWDYIRVRESVNDGDYSTYQGYFNPSYCRCVRFGEGETSEGSSGSSGSGLSGLGSSQPITMIGPMYTNDAYPDFPSLTGNQQDIYYTECVDFCGQLEYDGYNDWRVPNVNDILNWIDQNGNEFIIENFDTYSSAYTFYLNQGFIASGTSGSYGSVGVQIEGPNSGSSFPNKSKGFNSISGNSPSYCCFCVR